MAPIEQRLGKETFDRSLITFLLLVNAGTFATFGITLLPFVNKALDNLNANPALAASIEPTALPKIAHWVNLTETPPLLAPETTWRTYSNESAQIVTAAEKKFGIKIITPKQWSADDGKSILNFEWRASDLNVLVAGMNLIPPKYWNEKFIKQFVLVRPWGTEGGGVGGGYTESTIIINTPESFSLQQKPTSKVFPSVGAELMATEIHEATHGFIEAHPEMVVDWNKQTGWKQLPNGSWVNAKPSELINDGDPTARTDPTEDIAESAGLLAVNPAALSQNRIKFFLTNPAFSDWSVVQKLKK